MFEMAHAILTCDILKSEPNDEHKTCFLLLLDKRCMTSVMKVCGMTSSYYSPHLDDVSVM